MAIDPDPRAHITSLTDFYALLDISPSFNSADVLRRAYRKGSLKYHPDKALKPDASEAEKERVREKWDLYEVARKLLEDVSLRSQYDNARSAREQKAKRDAALDSRRQAMLERLEKGERESMLKRSADDMLGGDAEHRRLAEMGRRAREELAAKRRAVVEREQAEEAAKTMPVATDRQMQRADEVPLEERCVKVRWPAEADVDAGRLERLFKAFGKIDSIAMGKVKSEHLGDGADVGKRPVARAYVEFVDRVAAYDAIDEWRQEKEAFTRDWDDIEDVTWFLKQPPAWAQKEQQRRSRADTPQEAPSSKPARLIPNDAPRSKPSFKSFPKKAAANSGK